jgi:cellulose synthase/poly-beta-1,6-N-acetylglucosamine synthase-like glycosyltransferase
VKGFDQGLAENLAALAAQDYPDYELIVVVRDPSDVAPDAVPATARLLVSGSGDLATSHKITNLLAAVAAARPETQVFACADSDGRPNPTWLRSLAAELRDPQVGAATGYRWYVPTRPTFASTLRSVWNAAIAGGLGPGNAPFCWGGAMAVTRANFEKLEVRSHWLGQVSDDFELSRAVHQAGLRVAFAPGAVVPCLDECGLGEFFGWARRQLILTRVYAPRLWWLALVAHILYVGAIITSLAVGPTWVAAVIIGIGIWKAAGRAQLFHRTNPQYRLLSASHGWTVTLATFVWLALLLTSAFSRTIVWRGIRYRLGKPV